MYFMELHSVIFPSKLFTNGAGVHSPWNQINGPSQDTQRHISSCKIPQAWEEHVKSTCSDPRLNSNYSNNSPPKKTQSFKIHIGIDGF